MKEIGKGVTFIYCVAKNFFLYGVCQYGVENHVPHNHGEIITGLTTYASLSDPLSYFSFQPVLHDWCNKGRGVC